MTRYDVIVVGGGPAGSTMARALVAAGLEVVVFDRAVFPRDKPCAGWITPPVLDLLELDVAQYGRDRVIQPITGFRTGFIGGTLLETHYGRPVSYAIRRVEFDAYLLERTGAHLALGTPVRRIERRGRWWIVNDAVRAPLLVGAGGHFCPVARALQPDRGREPVVVAQEVEFVMTAAQAAACRVEPEEPELYFCRDLRGYGWCVRKGTVLNVGFGRQDGATFPRHVQAFVAFLRQARRVPPDLWERWPGHAYLLYGSSPRPPIAEGALLVGDARGLAYDQSGEGIRPAIESALLAARVVLAADGRFDRERLRPYAEALTRRFGGGISRLVGRVPEPVRCALAARLLATRWFTRTVVLDRLFLHASLPPLLADPARRAGAPGDAHPERSRR